MNRLLLFIFAALLSVGSALSVPARPTPLKVKQADGTFITVMLVGDERQHYSQTLDGIPVVQRADGSFCYARLDGDRLAPTNRLAHDPQFRTTDELNFISTQVASREDLHILRNQSLQRRAPRKEAPLRVGQAGVTLGKHKGLVILVNFKDVTFNPKHTREVFENMLNGKNYTEFGNCCSVNEYFKAQSYDQFDLEFDVVGPYTLDYNMAYYGANDKYGNDKNADRMVWEACVQAQEDGVKFADYDWDGDMEAEEVFVVYAGYGEAVQGADPNTIWPHMYWLRYAAYNFTSQDGITVNTYACANELMGISGTQFEGIGTFCHEFSHCLGLPDFYDTSGVTNNFGLSRWSVMSTGCYSGDGYAPSGYTSYERMFCNWLTPTELKEGANVVDMRPISESKDAFIIYNEANKNEFYLLENRQLTGTDIELPGHGMLVLHVDYDEYIWKDNSVNNETKHQRCTIIPADNSCTESWLSLAGDPFPGSKRKISLTNDTYPCASLYNENSDGEKLMNKPIEDITESAAGLISFTFNGGGKTVGIQDIHTEGQAFTDTTPINVYTPSGRRLMSTTYGNFRSSRTPAGVYLIKSATDTRKVIK